MTDERKSITCPICQRTSHNSNDVEEAYCGACNVFWTDPASLISEVRRLKADVKAFNKEDWLPTNEIALMIEQARAEEREACAKIAEEYDGPTVYGSACDGIAGVIRARRKE